MFSRPPQDAVPRTFSVTFRVGQRNDTCLASTPGNRSLNRCEFYKHKCILYKYIIIIYIYKYDVICIYIYTFLKILHLFINIYTFNLYSTFIHAACATPMTDKEAVCVGVRLRPFVAYEQGQQQQLAVNNTF